MSSNPPVEAAAAAERKDERPVLQFSVMCDALATPKELGNKPVFIGVFANLLRPTVVPQFFFANRWVNGTGTHSQVIRLLDPTLKELMSTAPQEFVLQTKVNSADVYAALVNINFASAGVYWVRIELDGKLALAYPLPVLEGPKSS
jgi:hypothetical protein